MSRIIQNRINPGAAIDAADLNTRFTAYSQPGALDLANHAAGSVDLPQVRGQSIITLNALRTQLGTGTFDHATVETVPSATSSPATRYEIGGGTTRLVFGGSGWTIGTGEVLRVYWDTSARPIVSGRPYAAPGLGTLAIDNGSGGATDLNDCFACWVAHLQWDTTSALLTNFAAVPGQSDFTPGFSSVQSLAGSSLIPAYLEYSPEGHAADGLMSSAPTQKALRWMGTQGSWFTARGPTSGVVTVYGLRIVVSGIYHAAFTGSDNRLELFTALAGSCTLDLSQGRLIALHQRLA